MVALAAAEQSMGDQTELTSNRDPMKVMKVRLGLYKLWSNRLRSSKGKTINLRTKPDGHSLCVFRWFFFLNKVTNWRI